MGWQDREYNAGREQMKAYMANPGSLLSFALPVFRSAGLSIHLSFWLLLSFLFIVINHLRFRSPLYFIPLDFAVILGVLLWHELGHRVFSRMVGGNHWEWVLWPLGGMVAPTCPRTPKATFVANVGGIAFSGALAVAAGGFLAAIQQFPALSFEGALSLLSGAGALGRGADALLAYVLVMVMVLNIGIILMNLFPCFWFDGGYIWQSILWPKLGFAKSLSVTCIAGMVLAAPLFLLSLFSRDFFGMVFWVLIFADCFRRRQMAREMAFNEFGDERPEFDYMGTAEPRPKKKLSKRWFANARKKALKDQAEQAKIDAILDKVKEKGLHSLSWWEKRTLRKATERQRQRDLAERM